MRDCPTRDNKEVAPDVSKDDTLNKRCFSAIQTIGTKPNEGDDDDC